MGTIYLEKINKILEEEPDPAYKRRARIIFENLELKGNEKVLEVGCGRGFYVKTLNEVWPKLDITGVDLNEKYLSVAKKFVNDDKVKLIKADATDLPFKDKSFDRIICSEVLEHIPDDQKAISEMHRVLKPGGIVIITVPNKNYPFFWDPVNWISERIFKKHLPADIWWLAGIWADHVRLYDEGEIRDKVEKPAFAPPIRRASAGEKKVGFKIEKVWYSTHYCLPFSHFLFYGIGKNLVEKGVCGSFNRFGKNRKQSLLNKFLLLPIRVVDRLNIKGNYNSCLNLIFVIRKPNV